jgi:predicted house-cleaning noncanonical NTP pyrophosphatase (MazG superfamily)
MAGDALKLLEDLEEVIQDFLTDRQLQELQESLERVMLVEGETVV